jgi:hypothetical protein
MKIKPKHITNTQKKILEDLAPHFDKNQLKKHFFNIKGKSESIYDLSFTQARKLIESLTISFL